MTNVKIVFFYIRRFLIEDLKNMLVFLFQNQCL